METAMMIILAMTTVVAEVVEMTYDAGNNGNDCDVIFINNVTASLPPPPPLLHRFYLHPLPPTPSLRLQQLIPPAIPRT